MKIIIITALICTTLCGYSQYESIPHLSKISPENAGFNRDSINALDDFISDFEQNDFKGMVVIKDHRIAIEYFYTNTERSDINDVRSAGKSLTALLLGIAIDEGLVRDLDQDVYSFFSKKKYPTLNEDLRKVKIKHLLDMSSGLYADADDWKTPGHAGKWMERDDWTSYILGIGLKGRPGKEWVYADINSALIGAIIEETSGVSLNDYAMKRVFEPLGIKKYYWYTNPTNQTVASGTLFLSTLDFAKLGVLVANEGKWAEQQIIPAEYVKKLIKSKNFSIYDVWSYGMLWYKDSAEIRGSKVEYVWASGNGGNHLIIVPEEELVIALTSTAYGQRSYMHVRSRTIMYKLFDALE